MIKTWLKIDYNWLKNKSQCKHLRHKVKIKQTKICVIPCPQELDNIKAHREGIRKHWYNLCDIHCPSKIKSSAICWVPHKSDSVINKHPVTCYIYIRVIFVLQLPYMKHQKTLVTPRFTLKSSMLWFAYHFKNF